MNVKNFTRTLIATGLMAGAVAANAATVNLVQNGSFEANIVSSGSWTPVNPLIGWQSDGAIEIRNNVQGSAHTGSNYIELAHNDNDSIWQSIATVAGQLYEFSFAYSPRIGFNSGDNNAISVSWDGQTLAGMPITGNGLGLTNNNWTVYSFLVTATSNSTLIRFDSLSAPNNSLGGNLDSISVSAVPLPGAALMFGSALLGAGALRRRKAKESAGGVAAA